MNGDFVTKAQKNEKKLLGKNLLGNLSFRRILFVIFMLLILLGTADAITYTVNFQYATTTNNHPRAIGVNYYNGANPGTPPLSGTPATAANIVQLSSPDGTYALVGSNTLQTHHFIFNVATSASSIQVMWRGRAQDADDSVRLYIYNANGTWVEFGRVTGTTNTWVNSTVINNPYSAGYIISGGWVYIAAVGYRSAGDTNATPYTDYIQIVANVPDSSVLSACAEKVSGPRDWDGFFDNDNVTIVARVYSGATYLSDYLVRPGVDGLPCNATPIYTNTTGYVTLNCNFSVAGVRDTYRSNIMLIGTWMTNGNAYNLTFPCNAVSRNIAITPGSYNITLIGRLWDNGGADWVRIWWVAETRDVQKVNVGGYNLPVAQRFTTWDFLLYKIGAVNVIGPNNDDDNDREGISANVNEVNSAMYPACIGPDDNTTAPYHCGQWAGNCRDSRYVGLGLLGTLPAGCCVTERGGTMSAGNCARYQTGYRISTLVEFNVPDQNLGEPGKAVWGLCTQYGTLTRYLNMVPYPGQEGNQNAPCTVHILSLIDLTQSPTSTEGFFAWTYSMLGMTIVRNHPHGGLGSLSFIGLWPDNQHVVGLVVGHRFGVHPFTALVTSMPSGTYPTDTQTSYWNLSFMQVWIYYLLKNLAYGIVVTADEWMNMHLRYPPSGEDNITALNRALNLVLRDFLPYLDETLWMLEASGNNTIKPFIVSTVTQLNDTKRISTLIRSNATLRAEFVNVTGTLFGRLPDILGPPDASTGLNYLLKWRAEGLTYTEKRDTNALIFQLNDRLLSFAIAIMRHIPLMEYVNTPASPGWNFNWIENSTQP